MMDWKSLGIEVAKIGLPLLGAVLPVPGGAAIGAALAAAIGSPSDAPQDILATLGASAEARQKAVEFQATHQERMLELTSKAELATYQAEIGDRIDARGNFSRNLGVFWLGVLTVVVFAILLGGMLWGCYQLLTEGMQIKDPGTVAVVFTLVGSIITQVSNMAMQVYSYFFGSSKSSYDKGSAMATALTRIGEAK